MTPAGYVEKVPTFTAVKWDGSQESADWILSVMPGSTRSGEEIVFRDSLDREQPLDRDVWVVLNPTFGVANVVSDETFTAKYEPAQ